jgi:RNA polymerase sigma-70 factor, ECF subfamily
VTPTITEDATLEAARSGDNAAFARLIAPYRRELRAHCYRMAGSLHDADDLLQESLVRAWRGLAGFEGRASLRTWLYKVATHVCLDKLDRRTPRTLPSNASTPSTDNVDPMFLEPCPADLYEQRETVAFAFLLALQLLTPKQRAVLILREVVGMQASECAELLDLSVAAVNSALQRAREVLADRPASAPSRDASHDALLVRYVEAWERADATALIALLREDATLSMPPMSMFIRGAAQIGDAIRSMVFEPSGPGSMRLVATEANGMPAFAAYQRDEHGVFAARALHVVELRDGKVANVVAFLEPSLFPRFGLPESLA